MSKKKLAKQLGAFLFSLAIAFVVHKIMAAWAGFPSFKSLFSQFPSYTFPLILLFSTIGNLLRFMAWHANLCHLGHRIPLARSLQYYLAGFLFLPTPARAGLSVRAVYLRRENVPYSTSAIALLIERLNDLVATLAISLLALTYFNPWMALLGWLILGLIAAGCILYRDRLAAFLRMVRHMILKVPVKKVRALFLQIEAICLQKERRFQLRYFLEAQILVCVAFGLYGLCLHTALAGLGADISSYQVVGLYSLSTVIASFSFIPTGLGGTEAVMLFFLSLLSVQKSTSIPAILLSRLGTIWLLVALGALTTALIKYKQLSQRTKKAL